MVSLDETSGSYVDSLAPILDSESQTKRQNRLKGFTCANLISQGSLKGFSEERIHEILALLAQDQSEIVSKVGFDQKSQQSLYALNWLAGFNSV